MRSIQVPPPVVAHRRGIRRHRAQREHRGRPGQHVYPEHAPAHVVDVVAVAVVARAHGDHGAECGRAAGRDLEAVEAAPGDADHAHLARAPGLLGQPRDRLETVLLLERQVLVEHDPVGVTAPAQVEANGGVAVAGEVGMVVGVAHGERVALAVGHVLEDRRHGVVLGVLGKPHPSGEPGAVGHRDPGVVDRADAAGKVGANAHGRHSTRSVSVAP